MSAAFTPGRWQHGIDDHDGIVALDCPDDGNVICLPPEDCMERSMERWPANARLIAASTIIPDLYASEINARIEWFWDGGFDVAIGDELNGWLEKARIDDWVDALLWLEASACRNFPDSDFARLRSA